MKRMALVTGLGLTALLVCAATGAAAIDGDADAALALAATFANTEEIKVDGLKRMKVNELRYHLARRDIACTSETCFEKKHFRDRLVAALEENVPVVLDEAQAIEKAGIKPPQPKKKAASSKPAEPVPQMDPDSPEMEELMKHFEEKEKEDEKMRETLRKAGLDPDTVNYGGKQGNQNDDAMKKFFKNMKKQKEAKKKAKKAAKPAVEEEEL